jgi:hypothetical protein
VKVSRSGEEVNYEDNLMRQFARVVRRVNKTWQKRENGSYAPKFLGEETHGREKVEN